MDRYLDLPQRFIGGISLNFAVNAKRCGAAVVSLVSRVGDDYAAMMLQKLQGEGIDTSHISIAAGETACQDILIANGERIFPQGGYRLGVFADYRLDGVVLSFVQQHHILACTLFKQVEPLFQQVIALPFTGWRVADFLDLSDCADDNGIIECYHECLTIAFVSGDDELVERLRPLSRTTPCLLVVTLGAAGSVALIKGEPVHQPAMPVACVVDTTGCGDAFQAAFTVSYWREGDVRGALHCGAQQAARVAQHYGAID